MPNSWCEDTNYTDAVAECSVLGFRLSPVLITVVASGLWTHYKLLANLFCVHDVSSVCTPTTIHRHPDTLILWYVSMSICAQVVSNCCSFVRVNCKVFEIDANGNNNTYAPLSLSRSLARGHTLWSSALLARMARTWARWKCDSVGYVRALADDATSLVRQRRIPSRRGFTAPFFHSFSEFRVRRWLLARRWATPKNLFRFSVVFIFFICCRRILGNDVIFAATGATKNSFARLIRTFSANRLTPEPMTPRKICRKMVWDPYSVLAYGFYETERAHIQCALNGITNLSWQRHSLAFGTSFVWSARAPLYYDLNGEMYLLTFW